LLLYFVVALIFCDGVFCEVGQIYGIMSSFLFVCVLRRFVVFLSGVGIFYFFFLFSPVYPACFTCITYICFEFAMCCGFFVFIYAICFLHWYALCSILVIFFAVGRLSVPSVWIGLTYFSFWCTLTYVVLLGLLCSY